MGGHQVQSHGSGDDGYEEDGYDESQRAEILEATRDGPTDGTVLTDLEPDIDTPEQDDLDNEDELVMRDGEVAEDDDDVGQSEEDVNEDEIQEEFDDGSVDDDELDDEDDDALNP